MALRAGRVCSYAHYAVMLEPVIMIHSWVPSSVLCSTVATTRSCDTNGDNLVKSGGCTDIAIFDTQDSNRKSHEISVVVHQPISILKA